MSTFKWLPYNTADTPTWAPTLTSGNMTNTAWSLSSEIDNSSGLYTLADLVINMSASVTPSASGYVAVYLLPNIDGNYALSSAGVVCTNYWATNIVSGGQAQTYFQCRGILMTPNKFKLLIQNNLGVAFAATATASLYRYGEQAV